MSLNENSIADSQKPEQTDSDKARVLIADRDLLLCELMKYNLEVEGYVVDMLNSYSFDDIDNTSGYALIIIDAAMLGDDSVMVASYMRQNGNTSDTPLVFTAASVSQDDMVDMLEAGVDAFLKKPFSMRELMARLNAIMRRYKKTPVHAAPKRVCHDDLCVNLVNREATIDDHPLDLTMNECQLLGFLMLNRNKLYSAREIIAVLWPQNNFGDKAKAKEKLTAMIESIRERIGTYAFNLVADDCFSYTYVE